MNNGELTHKKAVRIIQTRSNSYMDGEEFEEYCSAVIYLDSLLVEVTQSMDWMLAQLKWHFRYTKNIPEDTPDTDVEYSPELKKAMEILHRLKM